MTLTRFSRFAAVAALLAALCAAFAFAGRADADLLKPPGKQIFFGVTDTGVGNDFRDFAQDVGKHPAVVQTFHPWGNSLHRALPRWKSIRARPMLHITTRADSGAELITPKQIALGKGDDYLIRLNHSLGTNRIRAYIRPLGEPNRCLNLYAGVDCSGRVRGGSYAYKWYRSAFRRIATIIRGGAKRGKINARLKKIGLPRISKPTRGATLPRVLPKAPVAMVWSPLPAGSPTVKANRPRNYWPGTDWVDWVATDFYSRYGNWGHLKKFYKKWAIGKKRPMALSEFGLWGQDKPGFIKKVFRFVRSRKQMRMMVYYQDFGTSNEFRIQNFPNARRTLKKFVSAKVFPKFAPYFPRD